MLGNWKPCFSRARAAPVGVVGVAHVDPFARLANSSKNRVSARTAFSNSSTSTRSFGPWMLAKPSVAPEEEDLGVRGRLAQSLDERDRAAGRDLDGLAAPGGLDRGDIASHTGPLELAREAVAGRASGDLERDPERALGLEVAITAACASAAACSGCTRTLSMARAYAWTTALSAPSTGGTSIPGTVIAGAGPDLLADPTGPEERHARARSRRAPGTPRRCTKRRSTPRGAGPGLRRRRARRGARRARAGA